MKKVLFSIFALPVILFSVAMPLAVFAQTQVANSDSDATKKVAVPTKISGRWVSPQASQSFSLESIVVNGSEISGKMTFWAAGGDSQCNMRGRQVTGVLQDSLATIQVNMPCHDGYILTFDFAKKSGNINRDGRDVGRFEF